MSDWPKRTASSSFEPGRWRRLPQPSAMQRSSKPGVRWSVLEKDGKFYVVAFIGRDLYDGL